MIAPPLCLRSSLAHPCLFRLVFAVNCQMQQRTGSAMITACACYWDKTTDGYCVNKWESDQIQVLVTVFGVAI